MVRQVAGAGEEWRKDPSRRDVEEGGVELGKGLLEQGQALEGIVLNGRHEQQQAREELAVADELLTEEIKRTGNPRLKQSMQWVEENMGHLLAAEGGE